MSKIPVGLKCEITPEQAYCPCRVPEVPECLEFLGFKVITEIGTGFLDEHGRMCTAGDSSLGLARILVRRKPIKPRRWVVEFPMSSQAERLEGNQIATVKVISEVKPITKEAIDAAVKDICYGVDPDAFHDVLRSLGVEVE